MTSLIRNNQNSSSLFNQTNICPPRQKQYYQDNESKFNIGKSNVSTYNDYDLKNDFNR